MPMTPNNPGRRAHRGGFTFIEVMFAVIVLGVGVVMIATMLPVAIKTAQDTRESAAGTAAIESGFHLIEQSYAENGNTSLPETTNGGMFPNGRVWTYPSVDNPALAPAFPIPPFYQTIGNRVNSADPTFMWIPFYSRSDAVSPPQVAFVGVRARNIDAFPTSPSQNVPGYEAFEGYFDLVDFFGNGGARLSNYPLPVLVSTHGGTARIDGALDPQFADLAKFEGRDGATNQQVRQAAVEGAALVLVDTTGRLRVYRLAAPNDEELDGDPTSTDATTWTLQFDGGLNPAEVFDNGTPSDTDDDYNADAVASAFYSFGERQDFIDDEDPAMPGYLVGRMLDQPSYTGANINGWDATDNPHVGPSPVVQTLDGQQVR